MDSSENQNFEIHNTEITYLKGVGPKRGAALKKNGINNIGDIIPNKIYSIIYTHNLYTYNHRYITP